MMLGLEATINSGSHDEAYKLASAENQRTFQPNIQLAPITATSTFSVYLPPRFVLVQLQWPSFHCHYLPSSEIHSFAFESFLEPL
jgi:hypothetical protein